MKILIYDLETTGLPDFNKRARDPAQPHIVSVSAVIYDEVGKILEEFHSICQPIGWEIPAEATAIHGITNNMAMVAGIPEVHVSEMLNRMIADADVISSYNLQFDKFITRCALRRYDIMQDADDEAWKLKPGICIMKKMSDHCRIGKWPKLHEAYKFVFGEELVGAHGAVADRTAAARLFFWAVENKIISLQTP